MSTHANPARALDFSWQLAELNQPEDFLGAVAELLGRLIPSAGISRGHLDVTAGQYDHRGWPPEALAINTMSERMVSTFADHPMLTILTQRTGIVSGTMWVFDRGQAEFSDAELEIARLLQPVMTMFEIAQPAKNSPSAPGQVTLTDRETQVLLCVSHGLTARAAASCLRVSEATIHKHLENSYRKLGATSRVVAVDKARRAGLI